MADKPSGFEKFCGGTFWNVSLTWDTDHPDFTQCFQRTALVWVPCGFLFLLTLPYGHYLSLLPSTQAALSRLSKLKFLLAVLLAILSLVNTIKGFVDVTNNDSHSVPVVSIVSPLILLAAFTTSAVLVQVEWRKGQTSSGIQFLFYFMMVIAGIVPIHSYAYQKSLANGREVQDVFHLVIFFLSYALMVVQFLLFCFAEKFPKSTSACHDDQDAKRCPETDASFLSRITFWWMNGLILMGYKKTLEEKDMWSPNPRDITSNSAPHLEQSWKNEVIRCGCNPSDSPSRRPSVHRTTSVRWNRDSERTPLLSNNGHASREPDVAIEKAGKEPSFLRALAKVFGWTLLKAHALKLVCDVLTFVGPILQSALIAFTENDDQLWKGYFYSSMFLVSSFVYSCFFHQMFHVGMTLGMRVKNAVIALVYRKALTMSNEARKKTTVGEIVNLMSVDAQRLQDATGYLWMVWSCPLQIAIAVALLWNLLGISVLAGLIVMILLIPMNIVIVRISRQYQITQMHLKDERIKLMNEVLNGMKVLKLYAWELSFQDKIKAIRDQELTTLRKFAYLSAAGTFLWTCAPFVVTLATFTAYILSGGILDAAKAFTALSLFNILRFPMNMLPGMVNYLVTANVSIKRLGKFLQNKDIDYRNVQRQPGGGTTEAITITNGTFAWGTTEVDPPVLNNITLSVNSGSLTAVVGQVGAGKSSLLSATLGEMEKLEGRVIVRGSVAYVAQQAWIQNATLRDNVLFGQPFEEDRYNMVLDACALRPDLQILPAGDMTEIGEKGINLSGGQKQRVALARAVYQDCDIYLLDDPLSAVDAHVGKHIFDQVISNSAGLLKHKTRVLVTHGIHWLPKVDNIAVLVNGMISESGSYEDLLSHNKAFAQFLKTYLNQEESDEDEDDADLQNMKTEILQKVLSVTADDENVDELQAKRSLSSPRPRTNSRTISDSGSTHEKKVPGRQVSGSARDAVRRQMSKHESAVGGAKPEKATKVDKTKIIQEETSATGKVQLSVYLSYMKSIGLWLAFFTMASFILYQAASIGSSVWLSQWTEDPFLKNTSNANSTQYTNRQYFFLGIYGGFGVAQAVFILVYALVFSLTNVRSSAVLHASMLANILRSPMMFFETTPVGRILNRFSRDIETIDNVLPNLIRSWMNTFFSALSTIIIISYSTPIFLAVVVPLFIIYILVQRFYIPTSRQLKRIESTTRSPIYVHFSETITGCSTIRGFQRQDQFVKHSENLVDHNQAFYFATISSNRWLGFRLEILGALVVFAAAMFAVQGRGTISGGIVGLSISYALQITQALNWMVRMSTDLETNIVSVERVNEYSKTPTEADWHNGAINPPASWPSNGKISFDGYATRYRPGLDLVLRNIKVNIRGGEKIGIVGRTGAGKSSMTLALFRIIEAAHGSITIDDIKISDLALYPLRSKLVILPQDPVLFSGTLRMNLDPFSIYGDDRLWQALEHAHLKDYVSNLQAGLDHECGEGGHNLSVGQRQLVCLARAILRKTKILVLDEATAAVDLETDELIQKTIQQEFADCTVLTIAHRINTIMDSDRVMVLDTGLVREFDSPSQLLANKGSLFYALAKDAGIVKDQ